MTRHLRRLALAGFTALVLAMSSAPTADAAMYPYGYSGYYSSYYGPYWGSYYSSYYSPYYTSYYSPVYNYGYSYSAWRPYGCCGYSPCGSCGPSCDPCGSCCACAGGDCAAGCASSSSSGPLRPAPDGNTSGPSKTFGNGSQDKDWRGTQEKPPAAGTTPNDQREYTPRTPPEGGSAQKQETQKVPTSVPVPQRQGDPASPPDQQPENAVPATQPAAGSNTPAANDKNGNTGTETGPKLSPDVAAREVRPLAGLDRKVTSASTPERTRSQFRWRLAGERIVRKTVDPLKSNDGLEVVRLVKK
ncbi:MAG: hypothetical protein WD648_05785 [Planctomycetaceae bacterium]